MLWTPRSGWGVGVPDGPKWRHDARQPANLAVESAEESLTILPDYTTTVRPPPKRLTLIETSLQRLTCLALPPSCM